MCFYKFLCDFACWNQWVLHSPVLLVSWTANDSTTEDVVKSIVPVWLSFRSGILKSACETPSSTKYTANLLLTPDAIFRNNFYHKCVAASDLQIPAQIFCFLCVTKCELGQHERSSMITSNVYFRCGQAPIKCCLKGPKAHLALLFVIIMWCWKPSFNV